MFADFQDRLSVYAETLTPGTYENDLVVEARRRLRQLDDVLGKARNAVTCQNSDDVWTYTEAFYLFAWRLRGVLRTIPNMGGFECREVLLVRNHLIEHPDAKANVFRQNIAFGQDNGKGPILKFHRTGHPHAEANDNGLYINADALKTALDQKLTSLGV